MKKFFSICSAIAIALTTLCTQTSCGGGGGDTNTERGFVDAQNFRSGKGFLLLGNPRFRIEAGYSEDVEGYHPSFGDGQVSGLLPIPGTGREGDEDYDLTDNEGQDESLPPVAPEYLNAVGKTVTVYRRVSVDYTTDLGNCIIQYTMTKQNIGVATISIPGGSAHLEDDDLLSSLGAYPGQQGGNQNNNQNQDNTNRGAIASLSATQIEIHFDFNTGMATTYITATNVRTDGDNDMDFNSAPVVLSASAVPFRVL